MMIGLALRLLSEGRKVEIEVAGMSMAPLIRKGDKIIIAPAIESELRVHDIAVVRTDGKLLAHRVVSIAPLRTKGDLADAQDPEWPADSVIGVVIGVRRGGRTFSTGSLEGRLRSWWSRAIPLRWRR